MSPVVPIIVSLVFVAISLFPSENLLSEEYAPKRADNYWDYCGLDSVVCPYESPEMAIREASEKYGVDYDLMRALAICESQMGKYMVGDTNMPRPSYGLYQISLHYHPEITVEQAMDYRWSADWTAKQISEGRGRMWSCWDKINK